MESRTKEPRHMNRMLPKWFALVVQLLLIVNNVKCEMFVEMDNTTVTNSSTNYFNQNKTKQQLQNLESMGIFTTNVQSSTKSDVEVLNGDESIIKEKTDSATTSTVNLEDYG